MWVPASNPLIQLRFRHGEDERSDQSTLTNQNPSPVAPAGGSKTGLGSWFTAKWHCVSWQRGIDLLVYAGEGQTEGKGLHAAARCFQRESIVICLARC